MHNFVKRIGGSAGVAKNVYEEWEGTPEYQAQQQEAKQARRECSYCAHRDTCMAARSGYDCGPGRPSWEPLPSGVGVPRHETFSQDTPTPGKEEA